jgi:phytoene synthase
MELAVASPGGEISASGSWRDLFPTRRALDRTRHASAQDVAQCREMIKGGSKSFFAASLLLPRRLREPAYALYAFCRLSDDMVDIDGGTVAAVARLRERLDQAYAGRPADSPVCRSFADTVRTFAIPRALPEALLEGLEWDARGDRVHNSLSDVYHYAARVAGAVGAMMATLMDARSADQVARACDLGVAMQLTNIARDVGEDARNGRLYLPRDWMRAEGIDPDAWLKAPQATPALARVVARLLDHAEALYDQADLGIAHLPASCRPGIRAASRLYEAIGTQVAKAQHDSVNQRATTSLRRKLWLLAGALAAQASGPDDAHAHPALPETQFLVDAVVAATPQSSTRSGEGLADHFLWAAALLADLDARKTPRRLQAPRAR